MSRQEVLTVFQQQQLEPHEAVIDFQVRFGGYEIAEDLTWGLFYPEDMALKPAVPVVSHGDEGTFFDCALLNLWQVHFQIDECGVFYEDGFGSAESISNLIEHWACIEEIRGQREWTHISMDRLSTKRFEGFFDESKLSVVTEGSDSYRQILVNDEMFYIKTPTYQALYVTPEVAKKIGGR